MGHTGSAFKELHQGWHCGAAGDTSPLPAAPLVTQCCANEPGKALGDGPRTHVWMEVPAPIFIHLGNEPMNEKVSPPSPQMCLSHKHMWLKPEADQSVHFTCMPGATKWSRTLGEEEEDPWAMACGR